MSERRQAAIDARSREQAERLIAGRGERITEARVRVLAVLLAADTALSHQDVVARLSAGRRFDRVTVYRTLDWLTSRDLAHRVAGEDRVRLFSAVTGDVPSQHAHFQCEGCGSVRCLPETTADLEISVPPGFQQLEVVLVVRGYCVQCGGRIAASRFHGATP